ncbi:TauD/TfdA family dioxygenase [Pseudomonas aeruginosa]|nr:TauD/TfdA family dioxygenase [Pseudomonas aeruginosa]
MHVGELPAQCSRAWRRQHLLLLRGFAAFADAESLTRYCHDFGEVMAVRRGARAGGTGGRRGTASRQQLPCCCTGRHAPGDGAEFELFHRVDAPGDSDGGRTTFSSTSAALQLADSSELELWRRARGRYQRSAAHYSSRSAAPIVERHPRRESPSCASANRRSRRRQLHQPSEFHYDGIAPEQQRRTARQPCAAACTTHRRTTPTAGAATTW